MGEIADLIIDGFIDSETGEVIDGDSSGYPRVRKQRGSRNQKKPDFMVMLACPICGKRCKSQQGVEDHKRAKHLTD